MTERATSVPTEKRCSKCRVVKPAAEFYRCKQLRCGLLSACKQCCYYGNKHPCEKCGKPVAKESRLCHKCARPAFEASKNPNWKGGRHLNYGYSWVSLGQQPGPHGKPVTRYKAEHRIIMEAHLGRPLRKEETVHHKNGHRSDNRMENLELWSKAQPPGQRVEDKVAYAKEILRLYEPSALNEAAPAEAGAARIGQSD